MAVKTKERSRFAKVICEKDTDVIRLMRDLFTDTVTPNSSKDIRCRQRKKKFRKTELPAMPAMTAMTIMKRATFGIASIVLLWFGLDRFMVPTNPEDVETKSDGLVSVQDDSVPPFQRLVFLQYHKTGHAVSRILSGSGFHTKPHEVFRRAKLTNARKILEAIQRQDSRITIVSAANMSIDWADWFDLSIGFVHFIRDPLDWCLSAYLYHRQDQIPSIDRWIGEPEKNRCSIRPYRLDFLDSINISNDDLKQVADLCKSLSNETVLSKQLRELSTEDGVRLEAARGLLGSSHGDLLLMSQHVWLSQNIQRTNSAVEIHTIPLSRFTESEGSFRAVANELCESGSLLLQHQNRSVSDCAEDFFRYGYIGDKKKDTKAQNAAYGSSHVTSNRLTGSEKDTLKGLLLEDPVLGPPLQKIQNLLRDATSGRPVLL